MRRRGKRLPKTGSTTNCTPESVKPSFPADPFPYGDAYFRNHGNRSAHLEHRPRCDDRGTSRPYAELDAEHPGSGRPVRALPLRSAGADVSRRPVAPHRRRRDRPGHRDQGMVSAGEGSRTEFEVPGHRGRLRSTRPARRGSVGARQRHQRLADPLRTICRVREIRGGASESSLAVRAPHQDGHGNRGAGGNTTISSEVGLHSRQAEIRRGRKLRTSRTHRHDGHVHAQAGRRARAGARSCTGTSPSPGGPAARRAVGGTSPRRPG